MLAAFPNNAFPASAPAGRLDATAGTLARAVAFIEANPDLDIGAADIARAASVTVRAVHLAFRRYLDTTPMTYLRRVRLDRAHADLRQASPGDGATVTSIAARWGSWTPAGSPPATAPPTASCPTTLHSRGSICPLVRTSQHSNRKLRDVAAELVYTGEEIPSHAT